MINFCTANLIEVAKFAGFITSLQDLARSYCFLLLARKTGKIGVTEHLDAAKKLFRSTGVKFILPVYLDMQNFMALYSESG
jgi:hypothetical protein